MLYLLMYSWAYLLLIGGGQNFAISPQDLPDKKPNLRLDFQFRFGEKALTLHQPYALGEGDTLIFTKIQFYIAKPTLKHSEGKDLQATEDFYLVRLEEDKQTAQIDLGKAPHKKGTYTSLNFGIGLDSIANHSGRQTGALDPLNGMFWTWSQGYIFFKVEGYYHASSGQKGGFIYHIGGDECDRKVSFKLPNSSNRQVMTSYPVRIQMERLFGRYPGHALRLEIPKDTQKISVMGGVQAPLIADNFRQAFMSMVF